MSYISVQRDEITNGQDSNVNVPWNFKSHHVLEFHALATQVVVYSKHTRSILTSVLSMSTGKLQGDWLSISMHVRLYEDWFLIKNLVLVQMNPALVISICPGCLYYSNYTRMTDWIQLSCKLEQGFYGPYPRLNHCEMHSMYNDYSLYSFFTVQYPNEHRSHDIFLVYHDSTTAVCSNFYSR